MTSVGGGAAAQASQTPQAPGSIPTLDESIGKKVASLPSTKKKDKDPSKAKRKKAVFCIDTSGSTAGAFGRTGMTVLQKEEKVLHGLILAYYQSHDIEVITFDSTARRIVLPVIELDGRPIYELPRLNSGGGTETHLALELVRNADLCVVITDGQSGSRQDALKRAITPLQTYGTVLEILSVNCSEIDFQRLGEGFPPGMDLLQHIGNDVSKVEIYTPAPQYIDSPFLAAQSNALKGDTIPFGNHQIPKGMPIPQIANLLLEILESPFVCTPDEYLKFVMRCWILIGKFDRSLLTNKVSAWSTRFLQKLYQHTPPGVSPENILRFAIHGVRSVVNQYVDNTNLDKKVAASNTVEKQLNFKETDEYLRAKGTSAEKPILDFLSTCGILVSAEAGVLQLTQSVKAFPNSKTADGLYAIGHGVHEQKARQSLRAIFQEFGLADADKGPLVTGAIALMMLQHLLLGQSIDSEFMQTLTTLMKQQQGMDVILEKGRTPAEDKRSGPIREEWKAGRNPPVNPTTPDVTHARLLAEGANPWKMTEESNWAVLMALHQDAELFAAQLHIYESTLELLGVGKSWQEVLAYFVAQYKDYVTGTSEVLTIGKPEDCIMSGATLADGEPFFKILDHENEDGEPCTYGSCLCIEEQAALVGCPWCNLPAWKLRLEQGNYKLPLTLLQEKIRNAKPFVIKVPHHLPCMIPECPLPNGPFNWSSCRPAAASGGGAAAIAVVDRPAAGGGGAASVAVSAPNPVHSAPASTIPMNAIFLVGSVGAGKSTARMAFIRQLEAKGQVVVHVNSDEYSKAGQQKQANSHIQKKVAEGKKLAQTRNVPYIVIFDVCNERFHIGNPDAFGIKIRGIYKCFMFMVNFDAKDTEGYRAWSLMNVLGRAPPSAADHWWLNPRDAGLATCIKVSNDKITTMFATNGIPGIAALDTTMSEDALRTILQPHVERYSKTVPPVEESVRKFIEDNNFGN